MTTTPAGTLSEVPDVTLLFWVIKILATTLGETGGDAVTMSMLHADKDAHNGGYLVGAGVFLAIFIVAVIAQIVAKRFNPMIYWTTIVATTTLGTTLADFFDRSLGVGYAGGSSILLAALLVSLGVWRWREGSVSVATVATPRVEMFYWVAILFSQTLGTALGDWMADSNGLGYEGGAVVFFVGLAVVAGAYYFTSISRTLLFWTAFILTRPLGATLGDLLDKPMNHGGLAISRVLASAVLAAIMIARPDHPAAAREASPRSRRAGGVTTLSRQGSAIWYEG